jgi:hypothetical protein
MCDPQKNPLVFGSIWEWKAGSALLLLRRRHALNACSLRLRLQRHFLLWRNTGVIGSLQALEAIKYLTDTGQNLKNKILVWEGRRVEFKTYKAYKTPNALSAALSDIPN